jgi:hypothetical protein
MENIPLESNATYICSVCNEKNNFRKRNIVDVNPGSPDHDSVIQMNFFLHTCIKCKNIQPILHQCIFNDDKNKFLIHFYPGDFSELQDDNTEVPDNLRDYRLRYVSDPFALTEKIMIFQSGLNDIAIEILRARIFEKEHIETDLLYFSGLIKNEKEEVLVSFYSFDGDDASPNEYQF